MADSHYTVRCKYEQAFDRQRQVGDTIEWWTYYERDTAVYKFTNGLGPECPPLVWQLLLEECTERIIDLLCEKWPFFDLAYCTWDVIPPCTCQAAHNPFVRNCPRNATNPTTERQ